MIVSMEEFDLMQGDLFTQSIVGNGGCDSAFFDHHLHGSSSAGGDEDQLRKTAASLRHRRNSKVNILILHDNDVMMIMRREGNLLVIHGVTWMGYTHINIYLAIYMWEHANQVEIAEIKVQCPVAVTSNPHVFQVDLVRS